MNGPGSAGPPVRAGPAGHRPPPELHGWQALGAALVIALAYYGVGRLALLLALPPGYATAVWPSAGVALAGVLLAGGRTAVPAIWIGSFLLNLSVDLDLRALGSAGVPLLVSAVIAAGAALQAWVGGRLVQRYVGYHNLLAQEMDVIRILLLGGPVACLINSVLGPSVLWAVGKLPLDAVPYSWWTWWVGDSIGVMVFAPLVLVWSVRPYAEWLVKQLAVTLPLVVLFALVVVLFVYSSQREQERIEQGFQTVVRDAAERLQRDVDSYLQALYAVRGLYATSQGVKRSQFVAFGKALVEPLPSIQALEWVPMVPGPLRQRFEASVRADGLRNFSITERDRQGIPKPAALRAQHFPVHFVTPLEGNEGLIGFDLASDPARLEALTQARDSGQPVMTSAIRLLNGDRGVLAVLPIYWEGFPQDSVSTRRQNLHGFAVAVIRLQPMLAPLRDLLESEDASFRLYDDAMPVPESLLYGPAETERPVATFRESLPLYLAGRPWRIEVLLPEEKLLQRRSWQAWGVLAVGLLLTSLVGIMLLLAVGRTARIQALVDERTAELRRLNRSLMAEIEQRRKLETEAEQRAAELAETNQELQRRDDLNRELLHNLRRSETTLRRTANELAESNRELEQFAYVASHDLKAPLRTVSSFSQLLGKRYAAKLDDEAREFLKFISDGIRHMQGLIDDLLQLSRVDARSLHIGRVAMADVARQVCRQVGADLEATQGKVEIGELPEISGDARLLGQLLQNLISNGIKFQKPGAKPHIRIDATPDGDRWHFTVKDNGIGIEENHLSQIFMIFKRLHTSDQYPGSGIGLAICRKVVQLHGGEIWATSAPGEGTTIHFTVLREPPAGPGATAPVTEAAGGKE